MAKFNLAEYQTVEDRLREFLSDHPDARILTSLEEYDKGDGVKDKGRFILKATIFTDGENLKHGLVKATGYAEEIVGQGMVNGTSALENGETSAIGRALANAGYAPKGKRPSREEMIKVESRNVSNAAALAPMTEDQLKQLEVAAINSGKDASVVLSFAKTQPASAFDKLLERANA